MNAQCLTKNSNIIIKQEIHEIIGFYSSCIDCGFKKFKTIDKKTELKDILKAFNNFKVACMVDIKLFFMD